MRIQKSSMNRVIRKVAIIVMALIIIAASGNGTYQLFLMQTRVNSPTDHTEDKTPAAKKDPVMVTLPTAQPFRAIEQDYTKPDSLWLVVNKIRPIPLDYAPTNLTIPDVATRTDKSDEERSVRSDIETPIKDMFKAASVSKHSLMIGSAYRSAALQKYYFNNYARVSGEAAANQYSARPGQSEHQTGLSIDITSTSFECYLDECFANTPDGQWLAANAHKYGFILRYPKNKETTTGYQFEPWHYRYVGIDLATALQESNLTLEEAWPHLEDALKKLKQNGTI